MMIQNFMLLTERQFTSTMLSTIFGSRCPRYENSMISRFIAFTHDFDEFLAPGAHPPIDIIPILQYIPERWAPWKAISRDLKERQQSCYYELYDRCKRRMEMGRGNGCFLEGVISEQESLGLTKGLVA